MEKKASELTIDELVGKRVKSLRKFSSIPVGTIGRVVGSYKTSSRHSGITVEWETTSGYVARDGFGRDDDYDETRWLAIVEEVA